MPLSVRLDPETQRLVNRLVGKTGRSKSEIVRDALRRLAESEWGPKRRRPPFDAIAHLVGCVSGGPPDLSERTGEKLRKLLMERRRP
jgi:hypothetical protein